MGNAASGPKRQKHDWSLLLSQYDADYLPLKITVREFCKEKDLPYAVTSNAFKRERTRSVMAVFHDRNKPMLLASQRIVMQALIDSRNWGDPKAAAMFALKVYEIVADREEPKPEMAPTRDIILPPLFPHSAMAAKAIESLTAIQSTTKGNEDE